MSPSGWGTRQGAPARHVSSGLLAAMRGCPWAYDSEPPLSYDGNQRPACLKWKGGDAVLGPWVRKRIGVVILYETIRGSRAGEVRQVFLPNGSRYDVTRFQQPADLLEANFPPALLEALQHGDPDLLEIEAESGVEYRSHRDAWHYADVRNPGLEAVTCAKCLSLILEVQGIRADVIAERAEFAHTKRVEAELDAERDQRVLGLGRCPRCDAFAGVEFGVEIPGETEPRYWTDRRACFACSLEWHRDPPSGIWVLLNSTNRGTDATT